jgi:hypothetical protein
VTVAAQCARVGARAAAVVLVAGWLWAGSARAEPIEGSLSWNAAPTCLDESTAKAALGALLGEDWLEPGVAITVELVPTGDAFELTVRTLRGSDSSERTLRDPSCEALSEAGILVVALSIRPDLELGPGDRELLDRVLGRAPEEPVAVDPPAEPLPLPEPPPRVEPLPPPEPLPPAEPAVEPEPAPPAPEPEQPPLRGAMLLRGGLGWGMLPTLEGGPLAGGAILLPKARFEVDARGWFGPPATVSGSANVAISSWAIGLRGGPSWTRGPVVLPLMLGTEVGQLVGRPEGLRDPKIQRPTWWAFTATFGAVYSPIERLGLTAMLEGFVAVTRPSFSVEGADRDVHTPREGGIRLLLGVEARFPG